MIVVAPLSQPQAHPTARLFAENHLFWWVLQTADAAELGDALATLLPRLNGGNSGAWTAHLEGAPDRLRYVAQSTTAPTRPNRDGADDAVVTALTCVEATAILDRAETVAVSARLVLAEPSDAVREAGRPEGAPRVLAVLLRAGNASWGLIGLPTNLLPPILGAVISAVPAAPPPEAPAGATPRRVPRWAAPVLALAAVAAVLGTQTVNRRRPHQAVGVPPATQGSAAPGLPDPANQPAVVYDPHHRDVVLFGGLQTAGATWLLSDQGWVTVTTHAPSPSDRFGAAAAWDRQAARLVLFGGRERAGDIVNDTWTWDGAAWGRLLTAAPGPPGYEFSGMAWDQARRQMVLITPPNIGYASGTASTWILGRRGWTRAESASNPPAEPSSAVTFDPATRSVLLVLSGLSPGAAPSTWSWDGAAWHHLHPLHEPDLGGFTSFLAAIPDTRQLILTRVSVASPPTLETWTWDGADWTRQHPRVTPHGLVALIPDEANRRLLAIGHEPGISGLHAVWVWTGADWTRVRAQLVTSMGAHP